MLRAGGSTLLRRMPARRTQSYAARASQTQPAPQQDHPPDYSASPIGSERHDVRVTFTDVGSKKKLRLDAFLAAKLAEASRARIQGSIKQGLVTINGRVSSKPAAAVKAGDAVTCVIPPLPPSQAVPEALPLAVVYEDASLMVLNKAAGMVVHPSPGHYTGTLVNALLHHCGLGAMTVPQGSLPPLSLEAGTDVIDAEGDAEEGEAELDDDDCMGFQLVPVVDDAPDATTPATVASTKAAGAARSAMPEVTGTASSGGSGGGSGAAEAGAGGARRPAVIRPGIVHRLDRGTSGLLVVAKTERSHQHLCEQFKARTVDRTYWAVLLGSPIEREGVVRTNIHRDPGDRKRMAACGYGGRRGRTAVSNYKVLEELAGGAASLVQWKLQTGRTHQIRVHAKHLGHPLFADTTYGGGTGPAVSIVARGKPSRQVEVRQMVASLDRPALHALTLGFEHPDGKAGRLFFESQLPEDLVVLLQRLRQYS